MSNLIHQWYEQFCTSVIGNWGLRHEENEDHDLRKNDPKLKKSIRYNTCRFHIERVTHFNIMFPFYTSWIHQKTSGFLFSYGSRKRTLVRNWIMCWTSLVNNKFTKVRCVYSGMILFFNLKVWAQTSKLWGYKAASPILFTIYIVFIILGFIPSAI